MTFRIRTSNTVVKNELTLHFVPAKYPICSADNSAAEIFGFEIHQRHVEAGLTEKPHY
jgi:hypothetical protein